LQKNHQLDFFTCRKAASLLVDAPSQNIDKCLREMARLLDENRGRLKKKIKRPYGGLKKETPGRDG